MIADIQACGATSLAAIVARFAEQTSKGIMWRDIGLGDWLFDMDVEADKKKVAPAVLAMAKDPAAARAKGMTPAMHGELLAVIAMASQTNALATALSVPVDECLRRLSARKGAAAIYETRALLETIERMMVSLSTRRCCDSLT